MDYNKAVELGNKLLEEETKAQPSLGEIARQLRASRRNYVPPSASSSSKRPPRSDSFVVIEDVRGKPVLCRSTDATCRNAAWNALRERVRHPECARARSISISNPATHHPCS